MNSFRAFQLSRLPAGTASIAAPIFAFTGEWPAFPVQAIPGATVFGIAQASFLTHHGTRSFPS